MVVSSCHERRRAIPFLLRTLESLMPSDTPFTPTKNVKKENQRDKLKLQRLIVTQTFNKRPDVVS